MGQKDRFYVDIMALQPEVTGSCNLVIVKYPNGTSTKFIVDCGLFQEKEYQEYNLAFPFDCDNLEFVLVTHNHVDHIGRLPLLVKKGFQGKIFTTRTTSLLMGLALNDSYKVLKDTAKRNHTKQLYSEGDVEETLQKVVGCEYEIPCYITPNIKATFFVNGHLVGAALILVQISYPGYEDINILFTGDYNDKNMFFDVPQLPEWVTNLPLTVVQESTYGYMDSTEIVPSLQENIIYCMEKQKTAILLVFSLGRCQEILYILKRMQMEGKISSDIPIYLDGKLAIAYTETYRKADLGLKEEMQDFLPDNFQYVDKISRASLLEDSTRKIVVTTSGMGTYGPAQVYIPAYITQKDCLIQFTGYTAEGTLGRCLKDTPEGEIIRDSKGEVATIGGLVKKKLANVQYTTELSAHAKADEMVKFLKQFKKLKLVLVNHGEITSKEKFSIRVDEEVNPKNTAILGRDYLFRINPYGLIRSFSTSYR